VSYKDGYNYGRDPANHGLVKAIVVVAALILFFS
jgi:hypothetical protein